MADPRVSDAVSKRGYAQAAVKKRFQYIMKVMEPNNARFYAIVDEKMKKLAISFSEYSRAHTAACQTNTFPIPPVMEVINYS